MVEKNHWDIIKSHKSYGIIVAEIRHSEGTESANLKIVVLQTEAYQVSIELLFISKSLKHNNQTLSSCIRHILSIQIAVLYYVDYQLMHKF